MSSLPSVRAAVNFHAGKPGSVGEVILSLIGRSFIIGGGIWLLTGERDLPRLAKHSLAGATAIEAFVLYYTSPARAPTPPSPPAMSGLSGVRRLR